MSEEKSILDLANEHMLKRWAGGAKKSNIKSKSSHYHKSVNCVMCGRKMTTQQTENPPYYCYKCHDEAEGVFGRG